MEALEYVTSLIDLRNSDIHRDDPKVLLNGICYNEWFESAMFTLLRSIIDSADNSWRTTTIEDAIIDIAIVHGCYDPRKVGIHTYLNHRYYVPGDPTLVFHREGTYGVDCWFENLQDSTICHRCLTQKDFEAVMEWESSVCENDDLTLEMPKPGKPRRRIP